MTEHEKLVRSNAAATFKCLSHAFNPKAEYTKAELLKIFADGDKNPVLRALFRALIETVFHDIDNPDGTVSKDHNL